MELGGNVSGHQDQFQWHSGILALSTKQVRGCEWELDCIIESPAFPEKKGDGCY